MKTFLPHLIILTTLTGLAGCGSKAVGKLEVSQSFLTTNTSFGGGLVISGKHLTSGRTFSQSILSGKEMRISLEQGAWKISAVGWDGGGSPGTEKLFAGTPSCGTVTANLESSSTVVDLTINQTNCDSFEFTAGHTNLGGSLREFGAVITCNTFFSPAININSTISSQIIGPGPGTDAFCEAAALDSDQKSKVKAVKIYTNNKLPGQLLPALGFDSGCMQGLPGSESIIYPTNALNPYTGGYTVKLPFNNLPLTIVTFEDTSCSKPDATFYFKDGLAAGSPNFDHLLHERGSQDIKLLLPGNDLKRAKSALIGLLPSIKRDNAGNPLKYATTPSNFSSLSLPAIMNTTHNVTLDEEDCGTIASTGPILNLTCVDTGEQIELTYTGGGSPGSATITISDAAIIRRTFTFDVIIEDSIFNLLKYNSQARVIELVGQDDSNYSNFFGHDDDDKGFGVLSDVRQMFSADGAGGVLGIADESKTFVQACNDLLMDKTETIYNEDKMAFESYRVNIHDNVTSAPTNYMCVTGSLSASDCSSGAGGSVYDKRMSIFDHKISFIEPVFVMEFSCSDLVGRFELNIVERQGSSRHTNKKIVSWNTNPDSNLSFQRLEVMKKMARDYYNGTTWDRVAERRSMARIQKISADDFSAWTYNFETKFDVVSSTYKQKAEEIFLQTLTSGSELAFRHAPTSSNHPSNPYAVLSGLTALPPTDTIADKFTMSDPYPQVRASSGGLAITLLPTLNNADQIDGQLSFTRQELGTINFSNSFGTTFYTAP